MAGRFSLRSKQDTIRDLHERSAKVTNESALRTREMIKLMHECEDAGVNTLKCLHDQGAKLTRAENALDATEVELDKAAIRLQNIKRKENAPCCLLPCVSCFQKDPDKIQKDKDCVPDANNNNSSPPNGGGDDDDTRRLMDDEGNMKANFDVNSSPTSFSIRDGSVRTPDFNGTTGSSYSKMKDRDASFFPKIVDTPEENEIENNLDQVSNHLSQLKNIATDMNVETGKQNEQVGRMNYKADKNLTKLDRVTKNTIDLVNDDKPSSRPCWCCFL